MKRVSKQELDDMQAMIDSMSGSPEAGRTPDSNTKVETEANTALDAWGLAEVEQRRKDRLKKLP